MPGLSAKEKEKLKKATIYTGTASGATDGSVLFMLISTDTPTSPMRLADHAKYKRTDIGEFFDMGQTTSEGRTIPDGRFVAYMKAVIGDKIDKGELDNLSKIKLEISKIYTEFYNKMILDAAQPGANPQKLVDAQNDFFKDEVARINAERKDQINAVFADLRSAISDVKKTNKSLFTPTGIKAMEAEMKKFDKIKNPTEDDKKAFIEAVKEIAQTRMNDKNTKRGALLQDFYLNVANIEVGKKNYISKSDLHAAKVTTVSVERIKNIFTPNTGPDSTFFKIDTLMKEKNLSAEAKLDAMKEILKDSLAKERPGRKLKAEYRSLYESLIKFADQSLKGKSPNLDDNKLRALGRKIEQVQSAAIGSPSSNKDKPGVKQKVVVEKPAGLVRH